MPLTIDADEGNRIEIHQSYLDHGNGRISIRGAGSVLSIMEPLHISNETYLHIEMIGGGKIAIGQGHYIGQIAAYVSGGGSIEIANNSTVNQASIHGREGRSVTIGRDCMLAHGINIFTTDFHPIFAKSTGEHLNPAQDVYIGDHVWIAGEVLIARGSRIGDGSVVGVRSMVNGNIPSNCVAVGTPARVVRENIEWHREMPASAI